MTSSPLPDWYILKNPSEMEIDVNEWQTHAEERLSKFLENEAWIFNRPSWVSNEEWKKTLMEEVGGHFFLRLAVAKDPRLISWLVETEGDLFEFRFVESVNINDKISVLEDLFGEENVITIAELNTELGEDVYRKFSIVDKKSRTSKRPSQQKQSSKSAKWKGVNLDKRVAIKYFKVPSLIGSKRALLYKSWAILRFADVRLSVKRAFEKELKEVIEKSKVFLDNDQFLDQTIKPIRTKITEIARSTRIRGVSDSFLEGEEIFSKVDCYPPCIKELIGVLKGKGHLSHVENWQLGTFLKKVGMSIDQQLQFWYENSIDNVGQSFEEFVGKVSYQIKHIYGATGGGVDYDPPKCKTCIEGYYCYFAHKKLDDISEDIKVQFENRSEEEKEKAIDDISRLIINQKFQYACARYFNFHTKGWNMWENRTSHMLKYTEQAYKRFYGKKKEEDKKNEKTEPLKKGENNGK